MLQVSPSPDRTPDLASDLARNTGPDLRPNRLSSPRSLSAISEAPVSETDGAADDLERQPWLVCWTLAQMASSPHALDSARRRTEVREGLDAALASEEADFLGVRHPELRADLQDWLLKGGPLPSTSATGLRELAILLTTWEGGLLRARTMAECRTDRQIQTWARCGTGHRQTRHAVAECLLRQRHGGWDAVSWGAPQGLSDGDRRAWHRLASSGLLAALADGAATDEHVRCSMARTSRLCRLIDMVQHDDARAFLLEAHGPMRSLPALERVDGMCGLLDLAGSLMDEGPRSPGGASGSPMCSSHESVVTPLPSIALNASPEAFSPEAPPVSVMSDPHPLDDPPSVSIESLMLPSIGTWSSATRSTGAEQPVAREDIAGEPPAASSRSARMAMARASLLPLVLQAIARPGPRSPAIGSGSGAPSLSSLRWLPAAGSIAPDRRQGGFAFVPSVVPVIPHPNLTRAEVDLALDFLDEDNALASTPLDDAWRRTAREVLQRQAAGSGADGGVELSEDNLRLLRQAIGRSMRAASGLIHLEDGGSTFSARSERELAAMESLVNWVREGQGEEAVRREFWYDLIANLRHAPDSSFRMSARMLRQGSDLPPWSVAGQLTADDRQADRGTLVWRGEALSDDPGMARMLDALGVRNLDLDLASLNAAQRGELPPALMLDGVSVLTLHGEEKGHGPALSLLLQRLEGQLPGLYLVRLAGATRGRAGHDLPPLWRRQGESGLLVHTGRNANRERLDPLRVLWPGRILPPAFRARALNVHAGGEAVLDLLGKVREQRSMAPEFAHKDPVLALLLEPLIGGLAEDPAFARHCESMAKMPDGPCADGGISTLQAMAAMRDMRTAESLDDVALHALVIACGQRIDAWVAETRPDDKENLESAMVLRWQMSRLLREILGSDRVRASEKPLFGGAAEGEDWDEPARLMQFRSQALRLIRDEVAQGFPGVVAMLAREKDALGQIMQSRLDREGPLQALCQRQDALRNACDTGDEADLLRTAASLKVLDAQLGDARMALLRPRLEGLGRRLADWTPESAANQAEEGPAAKRARR